MNSPTSKKIPIIPFGISIMRSFDDEFAKEGEIAKRQEVFLMLPKGIKTKLSSIEAGNELKRIGQQFKLEPLQIASIARAIRNYYFGELKLEDFPKVFVSEMGIDEAIAQKISQMAIQEIIRDDSYEKSYLAKIEKAPFNEALRKYPQFGEQLITSGKIKLPGFPDLVRPSIKNWIADYTGKSNYEKGNLMIRQEYLFKNTNTQNLNSKERAHLSFVLKSFDENSEVAFNKDTKLLVFEEIKNDSPKTSRPTASSVSFTAFSEKKEKENIPEGELHFSFPQKMSFEKNAPSVIPEKTSSHSSSFPAQSTPPADSNIVKLAPKSTPVPKNVINLKEL